MKGLLVLAAIFAVIEGCSKRPHDVDQQAAATRPSEATPAAADRPAPEASSPPFVRSAYNLLANRLAAEYLFSSGGASEPLRPVFSSFPALVSVSAMDLNQQAVRNIAELDARLSDKRLLVVGPVIGIRPAPLEKGYIVELPGGFAAFDDQKFVATLRPGEPAQFVCTYRAGLSSIGYGLDGCKGLAQEAEQVGAMIALAPKMAGERGKKDFEAIQSDALKYAATAPKYCLEHVSVDECAAEVMPHDPEDIGPQPGRQ